MTDSVTANYSWAYPTVGADKDTYGGTINTTIIAIDAQMKTNADAATNASALASGTVAAARGGAGNINGILKANGAGVVSQAISSTDYAPATSGSAVLLGNGSGGFASLTLGSGFTLTSTTLTVSVAIGSQVSGLGTGVGTFLATPSSANLRAALTDETGTGAAVFAGAPDFSGQPTYSSKKLVWITSGQAGAAGGIGYGTAAVSGTLADGEIYFQIAS